MRLGGGGSFSTSTLVEAQDARHRKASGNRGRLFTRGILKLEGQIGSGGFRGEAVSLFPRGEVGSANGICLRLLYGHHMLGLRLGVAEALAVEEGAEGQQDRSDQDYFRPARHSLASSARRLASPLTTFPPALLKRFNPRQAAA